MIFYGTPLRMDDEGNLIIPLTTLTIDMRLPLNEVADELRAGMRRDFSYVDRRQVLDPHADVSVIVIEATPTCLFIEVNRVSPASAEVIAVILLDHISDTTSVFVGWTPGDQQALTRQALLRANAALVRRSHVLARLSNHLEPSNALADAMQLQIGVARDMFAQLGVNLANIGRVDSTSRPEFQLAAIQNDMADRAESHAKLLMDAAARLRQGE